MAMAMAMATFISRGDEEEDRGATYFPQLEQEQLEPQLPFGWVSVALSK